MGVRHPALILLASMLLAAHCQPTPADDDDPDIRAQCQAACDRFASLGCEQAQPTPEGVSCVDMCANVEGEGTLTIDPQCITNAAVAGAAGAPNVCFAIEEACAK